VQFSGKIALITSGGRGIARAIALRFSAAGAFVGVDDGSDGVSRDPQALDGVQAHVENIVACPAGSL
jgi:NAD(P)-dependent dehydrogenase (short-subunit alcohol dehydrogenase family)